MKKLMLVLGVCFSSLCLLAQAPPAGQRMQMPSIGHVYGKVVDADGKSISDASVVVLQNKMDTATKKMKEIFLKGTATQKNGDFDIEDLPVAGALKIKISATGYTPIDQSVSFMQAAKPGGAPAGGMPSFDKDLGKVKMLTDVKQLAEVTISARTSSLRLDIDKKVFSVDKNIVSAGGTALDVMKNVPSVNVDIDGNVALRNSTPQIYVDGRPTTLSLDQIPADAIESVEVITNPSAKFDASGGGAGILNIVLKKNKKTGYNGNVRAGVDKRGGVNGGVDFNARQGKVNFFGSLNVNQMKGRTTGTTDRLNLLDSPQTKIHQVNANRNQGTFVFGRAGLDYFITNRTTLSLAGFRVHGEFKPYETIGITSDSLYSSGTMSAFSNRTSTGGRVFDGKGLAFGLKYLFPTEGEELTFDANYFGGKNSNNSNYSTDYYKTGSVDRTLLQQIRGSGKDANFVFQTDYVKPIGTKSKFETGLRTQIRSRDNLNNNYVFDEGAGQYVLIPSSASNYSNSDNVYAAYGSFTSQIKNFGYKIGLRAESSNYTGKLVESNEKFSNS
ncbi:MAG TPA: outer membrane beta-barrel protein, partial [Flavitalea sp.]|nr:outer membrane beta-barrel protein [Flavitalea sp.]